MKGSACVIKQIINVSPSKMSLMLFQCDDVVGFLPALQLFFVTNFVKSHFSSIYLCCTFSRGQFTFKVKRCKYVNIYIMQVSFIQTGHCISVFYIRHQTERLCIFCMKCNTFFLKGHTSFQHIKFCFMSPNVSLFISFLFRC